MAKQKLKLEIETPQEEETQPDFSRGWFGDIQAYFEQAKSNVTLDSAKDFLANKSPNPAFTLGLPVEGLATGILRNKFGATDFGPVEVSFEERVETGVKERIKELNPILNVGQMDYQFRQIKGIAPGATPDDLKALGVMTLDKLGNSVIDPNKYISARGRAPGLYKGSALSDENNMLARRAYDVLDDNGTDARNELMKLGTSGQTLFVLRELKRAGFYLESQEISNVAKNNQGFGAVDEQAWRRFLDFSNQNFKTWQAMMPVLAQLGSVQYSGSGRTFRPTSDADMGAEVQEVSLLLTGNKMTKAQLKKALTDSINVQRAAFNANTDAPSPTRIAEQQVKKISAPNAASYGLGNAIGLAMQALGGSNG